MKDAGHIDFREPLGGRGARGRYELTAALFRGNASEPIGHENESKPTTATTKDLRCGTCGQRCKQLLKVGWCRSCQWKIKVRRIVREEMKASA